MNQQQSEDFINGGEPIFTSFTDTNWCVENLTYCDVLTPQGSSITISEGEDYYYIHQLNKRYKNINSCRNIIKKKFFN